jgi:uncharacterized protein (DUF1919 family)
MLTLNKRVVAEWNKYLFRKDTLKIEKRDFSIISSNCIGGRIYEILRIPYLTPTVGLYFYPDCFLSFVSNIDHYLRQSPKLIRTSRYINDQKYPVAAIEDVEVHFLHYGSGADALDKWLRRRDRVNYSRLHVTLTDRDGFERRHERSFDELKIQKKVLFSSRERSCKNTIVIPGDGQQSCVGNIYSNYDVLLGRFSFSEWINDGAYNRADCR